MTTSFAETLPLETSSTRLDLFRDVLFGATIFAVVSSLVFFPSEHDSKLVMSADGPSVYRTFFPAALVLSVVLCGLRRRWSGPHLLLTVALGATSLLSFLPALSSPLYEISLRRSVLSAMVTTSILLQVSTFDTPRQLLRALAPPLLAVMALNYLGVFLMGGVHRAEVIGAWRGLYAHKNLAGAGAAIATLVFLYRIRGSSVPWAWATAALSGATFLWFSQSKTAIAILVPAILVGVVVHRLSTTGWFGRLLSGAILIGTVVLAATFHRWGAPLASLFGIDATFTGRTAIWPLVDYVVTLRPATGWGFGIVFEGALGSPFFSLAGTDFLRAIGHAHNGFLNVLVQGGYVSLVVLCLLTVVPFLGGRQMRIAGSGISVFVAMWFFSMSRNMLEADLLEPLRPGWIFLLVAMGACLLPGTSSERREAIPEAGRGSPRSLRGMAKA